MSRNRKFKKKIKNMLATVATLVAIIGVSVGVTLALLATKTNEKNNTFTGSQGIKGGTFESLWDGSSATKPTDKPKENAQYYGAKDASLYKPDMVINKNPQVSNMSPDQDVWVMMRVEYRINTEMGTPGTITDDLSVPVEYTEFKKLAQIYNGDYKAVQDGDGNGDGSDEGASAGKVYDDAGNIYDISNGTVYCAYHSANHNISDGKVHDNTGTEKEIPVKKGINTADWAPYTTEANADTNTGYLVNKADPATGTGIEKNGRGAHVYYYYYYKWPLSAQSGVNPTVTNALFTTVHINSVDGTGTKITLPDATGETDPVSKYYKINYPACDQNSFFNISTEYNTYSALPAFEINVQSAIIAKEATDPDDLTGSGSPTADILSNLKKTFKDN